MELWTQALKLLKYLCNWITDGMMPDDSHPEESL